MSSVETNSEKKKKKKRKHKEPEETEVTEETVEEEVSTPSKESINTPESNKKAKVETSLVSTVIFLATITSNFLKERRRKQTKYTLQKSNRRRC